MAFKNFLKAAQQIGTDIAKDLVGGEENFNEMKQDIGKAVKAGTEDFKKVAAETISAAKEDTKETLEEAVTIAKAAVSTLANEAEKYASKFFGKQETANTTTTEFNVTSEPASAVKKKTQKPKTPKTPKIKAPKQQKPKN